MDYFIDYLSIFMPAGWYQGVKFVPAGIESMQE